MTEMGADNIDREIHLRMLRTADELCKQLRAKLGFSPPNTSMWYAETESGDRCYAAEADGVGGGVAMKYKGRRHVDDSYIQMEVSEHATEEEAVGAAIAMARRDGVAIPGEEEGPSAEEQKSLLVRARDGDKAARLTLIEYYEFIPHDRDCSARVMGMPTPCDCVKNEIGGWPESREESP